MKSSMLGRTSGLRGALTLKSQTGIVTTAYAHWGLVVTVLLCQLLMALPALGQVARGNITGTVLDGSGGRIAEAKVTIVQTQTGLTRSLATGSTGDFSATLLPVGTYTVTVARDGFASNVTTNILLTVDQTVALDIVLQPGMVTQEITVTAKPALLQPTTSSLGQLVGSKYMQDLPLNGRNPYALGLLSGNVVPYSGSTGNVNQPFAAGGSRHTGNSFLLDGVVNTDYTHNIEYFPSVDAVQEYKVQTSAYSAEFGNGSGYTVNLVTKSGTDQFHGSAYEYVRNDTLDAADFFTNAAEKSKAPFKRNQFGFSLGGPLSIHPRAPSHSTFFFFSYEGLRLRTAAVGSIASVPPLAFRQGDFSGLKDAEGNLIPIYDPSTRVMGPDGVVTSTAYPGNIIPPEDLNPVTQAIIALVPLPNYGAPGAQALNYTALAPNASNSGNYNAKIDHNFSSSNTVYLRVTGQNTWTAGVGIFPPPLSGGQGINRSRNASINFLHIFSPAVVNVAQFSATRLSGSYIGSGQDYIVPGLGTFPFPVQGLSGFVMTMTGLRTGAQQFTPFGGSGSQIRIENAFQWTDNLTIVKGRHTFKTGVDFVRSRVDLIGGSYFFGQYFFGPIYSSNPHVLNSGSPFADFLLGLPSTVEGGQFLDWARMRWLYAGQYFQDDWKATERLTFNLGIRYELWTVPVDARDTGGFLDVKTGHIAMPGKDGYSRGVALGDHNNFAPRFGFAYDVNPKIVVRGGYGLFYAAAEKSALAGGGAGGGILGANPPNIPLYAYPPINAATTVTPPTTISTNLTAVPFDTSLSGFSAASPWATNLFGQDLYNVPAQRVNQFNLSVQYQPWADWLFQLSYSGVLGRKLASRVNLNQEPWEYVLDGRNTQANRFCYYINGLCLLDGSYANSSYNAMNLKVEKSFSNGLQILSNYTWSHELESGTSGSMFSFDQNGKTTLPLDSFNLKRDYGPGIMDVTHYFVTSFVYSLPFGPGRHFLNYRGPVGKLLGGWQMNGITTLRSGFCTQFRYGSRVANFSTYNVPDRVSGVSLTVPNPSVDQWFNPAAFAPAPTAVAENGTTQTLYGNLAQRAGRGPGSFNLDFSLFKNFPITERVRLQFRAEAFNLTNTPTFLLAPANQPPATYGSTVFGKLSNASAVGRQVQLALRLDF